MSWADPANYLRAILTAKVYPVARETPLAVAPRLSARFGHHILLKREDTQPIFCYKIRGAYNKMVNLAPELRREGVVAVSAGNHAQGVAMSAAQLECAAYVIMPKTTPLIKVEAVRRWRAQVELVGDSYDEASEYAHAFCAEQKKLLIEPFDDPLIIAGQGTVGLELIKQQPAPLDVVFVPIGGGGLTAGVATYIKQVQPETQVIGVEPYEADAMYQSLLAGRRITLKKLGIFADGVAVRRVGKEPYRLCRTFVDEIVRVDTDEMCAAIKDIYEDTRTIVEPSGALALAGMKRWLKTAELATAGAPLHLAAIVSGANMDFDRLRHVAERAEIGEKREAIIAATIPETAGSFRRFHQMLGPRNVSEFNYRYAGEQAHIFVGIQIKAPQETRALIEKLAAHDIACIDLTDNELAKTHARYIVGGRAGGRAPALLNERLLSFEFPERPGALGDFLDQIGTRWNITLFHYRNHGSDFGRVLCGIQVPPAAKATFNRFLKNLGYAYRDESDNPIYTLFLH